MSDDDNRPRFDIDWEMLGLTIVIVVGIVCATIVKVTGH